MAVGQEGIVSFKVEEIFQHPTLYEAYPELADVPIDVFIKRFDDIDGVADYRIYNQSRAEKGIRGGVSTDGAGKKVIDLANASKDFGRNTILHEIQHLVQAIEGFKGGASTAKFRAVIMDAQSARVDKIITEDLVSGTIGKRMDDASRMNYAQMVAKETKASFDDVSDRLGGFLVSTDPRNAAIAASEAARTQRDLRLMLEVMGDGMSTDEIVELITTTMSFDGINELARSRYLRSVGEVEARLTEFMRDQTQAQILAAKTPPVSTDVTQARQIP